tara:strand:+ start:26 stop:247 length:222 start_codon:yes stop_codon:yes gene_type:complete
MELIDTPNPNAKKVMTDTTLLDGVKENVLSKDLYNIEGVSSVFFGPGFITVTKEENTEWEVINQDITNIFDTL